MRKSIFTAILLLFTLSSFASPSGKLYGVVTSEDGSLLPGVTVTLQSPALSKKQSTTTNSKGEYSFSNLPQGKYNLIFSMAGFQTMTWKNLSLKKNEKKKFNTFMKVNKLEESIVVDLASPVVSGAIPAYSMAKVRRPKKSRFIYMPPYNPQPVNTEQYDKTENNRFKSVATNPLSTFSIDVDTASYSNIRRFININGQMPAKNSVRIEEMINYFSYNYKQPDGKHPITANVEIADCPWNKKHRLAKVGIKGKEIKAKDRPSANLVFLLDVSGSMSSYNKLPLLKSALKMLLKQLNKKDKVAIVVYAGSSGLVLDSTPCTNRTKIMNALENLQAGGSTNGGEGIRLAYNIARENFIKKGINRVILATDGDFNVGTTGRDDLLELVKKKAKSDIFLTVLGFGMGNYKDGMLETLADKGNGNYGYIDTLNEARKVFVEQISGTLVTIAKDVKIQVEFNPSKVAGYRLIGYENRLLNNEDFKDDKKDAGEIGAGHTVTALYEIVPKGESLPGLDKLKYQKPILKPKGNSKETMTVKIRYKKPEGTKSIPMEFPVVDKKLSFGKSSNDFKFASSVALFGMLLRDMSFTGNADLNKVLQLAIEGKGQDKYGYRTEFINIVKNAQALTEKVEE